MAHEPSRRHRPGAPISIAMAAALLAIGASPADAQPLERTMPRTGLRDTPPVVQRYMAHRATTPILVDGRLDEGAWAAAQWSANFTDIEGDVRPAPRHQTRVRMVFDDHFWYIAAQLDEPDLWGTIRTRDAVIYQDNDFELFVDPDGDTHRYFELEINALGTAWDLFLPKPYRDGGRAVDAWNIEGLQAAVHLDGTLNDPRDRDRGWTVELAIPWAAFADSGRNVVPPGPGSSWRVNFSRVQWALDTVGGAYRKRVDTATGRTLPEDNWVWSPQGAVNMHMPEMWGVVTFGGTDGREDGDTRDGFWTLRRIYYAQREHRARTGGFASRLDTLGLAHLAPDATLEAASSGWEASLRLAGTLTRLHIRADGLTWRTETPPRQ